MLDTNRIYAIGPHEGHFPEDRKQTHEQEGADGCDGCGGVRLLGYLGYGL